MVHLERQQSPPVAVVIPTLDEVVIADGRSRDDTVARPVLPSMRIVAEIRPGKDARCRPGSCIRQGHYGDARCGWFDRSGQNPLIPSAPIAGADLAKGSRFLSGGGMIDMLLYRHLGKSAFVALVRTLFGARHTDLCDSSNASWSRVVPKLALIGGRLEIETMTNVRALKIRLNVVGVPRFEAGRLFGVTNLRTQPVGLRVLRAIWGEADPVPLSRPAPQYLAATGRLLPHETSPGPVAALVHGN